MPIVPSDSSLVNGITPLAMKVFATGMRSTSANVTSASRRALADHAVAGQDHRGLGGA